MTTQRSSHDEAYEARDFKQNQRVTSRFCRFRAQLEALNRPARLKIDRRDDARGFNRHQAPPNRARIVFWRFAIDEAPTRSARFIAGKSIERHQVAKRASLRLPIVIACALIARSLRWTGLAYAHLHAAGEKSVFFPRKAHVFYRAWHARPCPRRCAGAFMPRNMSIEGRWRNQ
jgi:hypothetical protein